MAEQTNTAICTCGEISGKPFCLVHGEPRYRYVTDPLPNLVAEIDRLRAELAAAQERVRELGAERAKLREQVGTYSRDGTLFCKGCGTGLGDA